MIQTSPFSPVWLVDGTTLSPTAPNHIGMSRDGVAYDLIPKANLVVGQVFSASPGQYPYPTMTRLTLTQNDGTRFEIELQAEKAMSLNGGTAANLNTAVLTVGHWVVNV